MTVPIRTVPSGVLCRAVQVRWSKQVRAASPSADGRSVTFIYTSKDGESG
jgi:hypothetical protein